MARTRLWDPVMCALFLPLQVTPRRGYLPQFPTSCLLVHRPNFILTKGTCSLTCLRSGNGDLGHAACHRVIMTEMVAAGSIKAEDFAQLLGLVQGGRCSLREKGSRNTGAWWPLSSGPILTFSSPVAFLELTHLAS